MICEFCGEKEYTGNVGQDGQLDFHGRPTRVRNRIVLEVNGSFHKMQLEIRCCIGCWNISKSWHMSHSVFFTGIEHISNCIRSRMRYKTDVTLPNGDIRKVYTHMQPEPGMVVVIPKLYPPGYNQSVNGELMEMRMVYISPTVLVK